MTVYILMLLSLATVLQGAELGGSVHDSHTGEALAHVTVKLTGIDNTQMETDAGGTFHFSGIAPGPYKLVISTVGYRVQSTQIELKKGDAIDLNLVISPDALAHRDRVDVNANPFELEAEHGPTAFTLSGTEAKNLASVLADDPMRALQSAPGVAGDDDFDSRFTLHGAPYEQVGLYLDGILLHEPFHTVQGAGPSGSIAVFNVDMVATMTVQSEGYGPQYEDRTAGVIDIESREGSTDRIHFRGSAGLPDAGLLAEGPFGKKHKGSWLISERKSYLQYFLKDLSADLPSIAFGFADTQAQLNYALTNSNSFSFKVLDGTSSLNNSSAASSLDLNTAEFARYHYTLFAAGWQFTPNHSFVLKTRAAFTEEHSTDTNTLVEPLALGYYSEWTAKSDATWSWKEGAQFQTGGTARPIHGSGFDDYYFDASSSVSTSSYRGGATYLGGYAQQSFTQLAKGLTLSFGGRFDGVTANHQTAISPQAAIAYAPWGSGKLSFAWGRYAEFPDIDSFFAENGSPRLLPAKAEHFAATFEQRLGHQTRVRLEAFARNDRNLLYQPWMDARLIGGVIRPDNFQAPFTNTLTGATKGAEVFIQKRTANGWTGWASYTYCRSEMLDLLTQIRFPSDQDQRHTLNGYLSYRLRPTLNLSSKFSYGSGFPVPGFFTLQDGTFHLAAERNQVRLPPYEKLDIRLTKSKTLTHGKMTFFLEGVNVLNHGNYRFDSYNGYDPTTKQAYVSLGKMFPILPSAGVTFEF